MPKRSNPSTDDTPKKARKSESSISPQKSATDDPGLTNISDEEMEMAPSQSFPVGPKPIISEKVEHLRNLVMEKLDHSLNNLNDLNVSEVVSDISKISDDYPEEDVIERRYTFDQYMRDYIVKVLHAQRENWEKFLEISIALARNEICTASIPITLISDLIEISTLKECEIVFEFVEKRLTIWKEPFFMNSGKNAVLRMCNDLLRRLSRAQNTIFCGKILIFLANYFPFSERSGLNIMSEFNCDNITSYKSGDGSDDPDDKMETSEEPDEKLFDGMNLSLPGLDKIISLTEEEQKRKVKVDYNLYVKFWSLQDFFRNPLQCYNKIAWKTFTLYVQDVLGAFTSYKIDASKSHKSMKLTPPQLSTITAVPRLGDDDLFFPKYLTNRRLLELQIGDPNFRKYFLTQLLIILQYLTTSVKFKSETQVLSDEQVDFVRKTTEKAYQLLCEISPGGKDFAVSVRNILKHEEAWSKWKNEGCHPFTKPAPPQELAKEGTEKQANEHGVNQKTGLKATKRRRLGEIIEENDKNNKFDLGNSELSRLWNICGNNLEACRSDTRDFLPSIEVYFAEAFKELDPEPTPPAVVADPSKREIKEKKYLGNANFGWRALRLLARNSPFFFQLVQSPPIHPLQNYLEYILKKITSEMEVGKDGMNSQNEDSKDAVTAKEASPTVGQADSEQIMEGGADDNDELLKSDAKEEPNEDEEEGEVNDKVRNLTDEEQKTVGNLLGSHWKKVAAKLQFKKDEIEYIETEQGKNAGAYMLKMWTEQEKEDATLADLLYHLEGLKLRDLVKNIYPIASQ